MRSEEIKDAMRKRLPVVWKGNTYEYIAEYILKYDEQQRPIKSLGLIDKLRRLVVVPVGEVSPAPVAENIDNNEVIST